LMEDVSRSNDLERLKTSLHYTVGELSKERGKELQVEFDKQLVAAVSSITHQYLDTCASDLQAFAKHAKRTVVQPEDVVLLTRRNPDLEKSITAFAETVKKCPATGASTAAGGSKVAPKGGGFVKSNKRKASSAASGGSKFKFPRLIE